MAGAATFEENSDGGWEPALMWAPATLRIIATESTRAGTKAQWLTDCLLTAGATSRTRKLTPALERRKHVWRSLV